MEAHDGSPQEVRDKDTAGRFTYFGQLPKELRLMIWEEAIAQWAVWAVVRNNSKKDKRRRRKTEPFGMTFLGSAPHFVGQACKEARRVLWKSDNKLVRGRDKSPRHWVDFSKTVVYLGVDSEALSVLSTFDSKFLWRFQHVAVSWSCHYGDMIMTAWHLANLCPNIRGVIFQLGDSNIWDPEAIYGNLPPREAAQYIQVAKRTLIDKQRKTPHNRRVLLIFGARNPHPEIHVLGPSTT
jgi:hypothetical protein